MGDWAKASVFFDRSIKITLLIQAFSFGLSAKGFSVELPANNTWPTMDLLSAYSYTHCVCFSIWQIDWYPDWQKHPSGFILFFRHHTLEFFQ